MGARDNIARAHQSAQEAQSAGMIPGRAFGAEVERLAPSLAVLDYHVAK